MLHNISHEISFKFLEEQIALGQNFVLQQVQQPVCILVVYFKFFTPWEQFSFMHFILMETRMKHCMPTPLIL